MHRTRHQLCCVNPSCPDRGLKGAGNIARHGIFSTRSGRRRRWICNTCNTTFSTNTGTPYYRPQGSRQEVGSAVVLRVEGLCKSAIARVSGRARNTVARWLWRAAAAAGKFNDEKLKGFEILELQVDELCTSVGRKQNLAWLFAAIEVSSRLWSSSVIGRRSYKNAEKLIKDVIRRSWFTKPPLVTSDGFKYYRRLFLRLFRVACVYGQVVKTRRNNRVIKVERTRVIGTEDRLKDALLRSEDSERLNTSFVERLNLTIRQASAYLSRRTLSQARSLENLVNDVALIQCWYNFVRPHGALRFRRETRTPAMQAGLMSRRLCWREVFIWRGVPCGHALARVIPFPVPQGRPSLRLAA